MYKKRINFLSGLTIFFLFLTSFSFSEENSQSKKIGILEDIVLSRAQNVLEVKILFLPYTSHRIFELSNPNRIVADLLSIKVIKAVRYLDVNDFGIKAIRVGQFKPDVARVVLDIEEQIPLYDIERIPGGLKLKVWHEVESEQKEEEERIKDIQEEEANKKKVEEKEAQQADPESERIEKLEKEIKDTSDKLNKELNVTKEILEEALNILNQIQKERLREKKRFVRIEALGSYFRPKEGILKDVYKSGMMLGAEFNVGVWDFVEFWLAQKFFRKKIVEGASGEEKRAELIPLEVGLKFRLNKGDINPYFGAGVGYYLYKETTPTREIYEKEIGFIGQAGLFIKFMDYLVFDIYAHYSYCRIKTEIDKFNVGGLHIGVGFGFEY